MTSKEEEEEDYPMVPCASSQTERGGSVRKVKGPKRIRRGKTKRIRRGYSGMLLYLTRP